MSKAKSDRIADIIDEINRLIIQDAPSEDSVRLHNVRAGLLRMTNVELDSLHAVLMFQEW